MADQGINYLPPATESNSDSEAERELDDEELKTTKEEVEEEVNLMQKEAEMSLEELKAMYTRMEENTNDKHDESDKSGQNAHLHLLTHDGLDDDETDEDYKPPPPLPCKYKEPRIGNDYQVDVNSIPTYAHISTCTTDNEAKCLWVPGRDASIEVDKFLVEHRKRIKIRQPTNERVANRTSLPDNEEALEQLLQCNYNVIQTHKRIKARARLTPKNRGHWTQEEMALFELGLTTIGKNFFKIHHQHLPSKDIKEIVLFYYKWKKTKRADSYGAKTRNSKRKFENCTNYMDKLLDDIETKRSRRGEKTKRAHVENGQENSAPEPVEQTQLPPEPVVMTLDLSSNGKWRLNSSTD